MSEPESNSNQISKLTTPTWEMELLVSGATVFGLMQLPGPLARTLSIWMNANEAAVAELIGMVGVYLQLSLVILIITFVLHLITRGYWVALVGMHSVFPNGIAWHKMKSLGQAYREVTEQDMGTAQQIIERADNRASLIFGLGFGLGVSLSIPLIIVGTMLVVLLILQALNFDVQNGSKILWLLLLIIFAPWFLAYLIDYQFGTTLAKGNKNRWLKKIFTFYQNIGMRYGNNAVITVFTTNSSIKKNGALFVVISFLTILASTLLLEKKGVSADNGAFDGLPRVRADRENIFQRQHYASLRSSDMDLNLSAYIEEPIVSKPFLSLFIPYQPENHNALMKTRCPNALVKSAANKGLGLACLTRFHDLRIDGKSAATALIAGDDLKTGQRGMIAMIDIRALDVGQHMLTLNAVPTDSDDDIEQKLETQIIYFWK